MNPQELFEKQKKYFDTRRTKSIQFRIRMLIRLRESIKFHEKEIYTALETDLRKSKIEALEGEIIPSLNEIEYAIKHVWSWAKPQRVSGPSFFPLSRGYVQSLPYGVSAIFSPYNHPFSTSFAPLVSAITAGNCIILKPSEMVPHCAEVIQRIITKAFPEEYVAVALGEREVSERILELQLGTIFFTGSTQVGRIIMESAAKKLIPVTLQLGGKCPGIIHADASLKSAAARIVWGKFWNAGQSCNTVDHLFVHNSVKNEFIGHVKYYIDKFYTTNPKESSNYGRILNERHFSRISKYIAEGNILHGGETDLDDLYIAPTIIDSIAPDASVMNEEIFGPVLPIFGYDDLSSVIETVNANPKPLAVYFFSKNRKNIKMVMDQTQSGTACINDLMIQATTPDLPIGGIGGSGFGRMHGKDGFDMFSYKRSILQNSTFDLPFRFPPYSNFLVSFLRRFL